MIPRHGGACGAPLLHAPAPPLCTAPAPPPQSLINGAASAHQLASLSVSPGSWPYWTQLDPFQVPAWLQPAQPGVHFTGTPRMPAGSAATLIACKLPGLKHLALAADAGNQGDFFLEVQRLGGLTSLDLLAGQPIASKPLLVGAGGGGVPAQGGDGGGNVAAG